MTSPWPGCSSFPDVVRKNHPSANSALIESGVERDPGNQADVLIHGNGVAANACVHLLRTAGVPVAMRRGAERALPPVLLSFPALQLLRDAFDRPDLFAGAHTVSRRIVAWGGEPVVLDHGAISLSGADLALALNPGPDDEIPSYAPLPSDTTEQASRFAIRCAPPFPSGELRRFGDRPAAAASVALRHGEDSRSCWLEAVADGWLFMIPDGQAADGGRLIGVGAPLDALVAQSRHIAPRIVLLAATQSSFQTAPRILDALAGSGWLACGTSAIAFDPICGDGTAQAIRSAILGSAVIAALRDGGDEERLLGHYEAMLIASMRRHLGLCMQFYRTGGTGPWWRGQLAAMIDGFEWCTARLAATPEPRFRLEGFRLVDMDLAA